jgi:putative ATPase
MPQRPADLFDDALRQRLQREAPLAARLRPRTLDEFAGQGHIIGPGRLLRRAIQADQLSSLIFYGPPGTGKTTLAMVIANTTRSHFITINAVLAGVADIRAAIADAQERRKLYNQRTILFVDEVHRFNKAQQDALLPWVENGTVILIGATTENPWFSVNRPLVSRSRIFQLKPLTEEDLRQVVRQALADAERGYGRLRVDMRPDALEHIINVSNGDARSVLNALELAVETTPPDAAGVIVVDRAVAEDSIQRRAVLYDKEGDYHFDTISAFIKSLRGSDPDAAFYWLAKMVYAGEDPRFIFRRMLIFAGEDIGMADPRAITVAQACADAFERVGLPEGNFHLAEAALYLATAPKSNSVMGYFDALAVVEKEREGEPPSHLKDANRDKEGFGHGEGYLYPHAYRDHWVAQQYLPDALQGRVFYQPNDQGYERDIRAATLRRREAQLTAMLESEATAPAEVLTFSPADRDRERWLQRAISGASRQLEGLRERVFASLSLQRHHAVLDLNAGAGLLAWEALRRTPEGSVWALTADASAAGALRQQVAGLPELERPTILQGALTDLPALLAASAPAGLRFDAIIGRNVLAGLTDRAGVLTMLAGLLAPAGAISLAENLPRRAQRLYRLADLTTLDDDLARRIVAGEEAIYADPNDPLVNWDADDLEAAGRAAGLEARVTAETEASERMVTPAQVMRWFDLDAAGPRPGYAQRLLAGGFLNEEELGRYRAALAGATRAPVNWITATAYVVAGRPPVP